MNEDSYDQSAELYDAAFQDIKVREIEWNYVTNLLERYTRDHGHKPKIVEVGCGNGQMLRQLLDDGFIAGALGLDASARMVDIATDRHSSTHSLEFQLIDESTIPSPGESVDIVISFMSYRYLNWPAIMTEVDRVLIDNGCFIMVDMAATELSDADLPLYEETKLRTEALHQSNPEFVKNLRTLVEAPQWKAMLTHHPRRQAKEYQTFLTERYPSGSWERLYVCYDHSLFGFEFTKA